MRPCIRRTEGSVYALVALVGVGAAVHVACSPATPLDPSQVSPQPAGAGAVTAMSQNAPPNLVWKTQPAADDSTVPPTISGPAPLDVKFNLCNSDDPDMSLPNGSPDPNGDSLNWQFNFGDDGAPAFNPDGTFNPDFDHFCRVQHTYGEGTFIATLSVTDKHLESESHGVTAMARRSQLVKIVASADRAPTPAPTPLPFCHALPSWCPSQQQFCEAVPIVATSSAQAKDACEACYGVPCADGDHDGSAWVAYGVTAFYYSVGSTTAYCTTQGYVWKHKPADVADITPGINCGAGLW